MAMASNLRAMASKQGEVVTKFFGPTAKVKGLGQREGLCQVHSFASSFNLSASSTTFLAWPELCDPMISP